MCFLFDFGVSKASTWVRAGASKAASTWVRAEVIVGVIIPDTACSRTAEKYTSFRATPLGTTPKEYLA